MSASTLPQVPLPFTVCTATRFGCAPQPQNETVLLVVVCEVDVLEEDEVDDDELDDDEDDDELDDDVLLVEVLEVVVLELLVVELLEVLVELVVVFVELVVVVGFGGLQTDGSTVHPPAGQSFARYLLVSSALLPVRQTRQ